RVARRYNSAPALLAQQVEHLHGKEGVSGSSPEEGSARRAQWPSAMSPSLRDRLTHGGTRNAQSSSTREDAMGQLILQMGISLDGLVARPGRYGAGGWGTPPEDPALKQRKLELIREAEAHLMGRNTYEETAGFWSTSDDEYAEPMNTIPK